MSFVTTILALSLLGTPEKACVAPAQAGTFRITAMGQNGADAKVGIIVLENINGCLEATLLTDDSRPTIIDGLVMTGDTLTGAMRLGTGMSKVTLELKPSSISGSIVQREHVWAISGQRTSGAARVADGEAGVP